MVMQPLRVPSVFYARPLESLHNLCEDWRRGAFGTTSFRQLNRRTVVQEKKEQLASISRLNQEIPYSSPHHAFMTTTAPRPYLRRSRSSNHRPPTYFLHRLSALLSPRKSV